MESAEFNKGMEDLIAKHLPAQMGEKLQLVLKETGSTETITQDQYLKHP